MFFNEEVQISRKPLHLPGGMFILKGNFYVDLLRSSRIPETEDGRKVIDLVKEEAELIVRGIPKDAKKTKHCDNSGPSMDRIHMRQPLFSR